MRQSLSLILSLSCCTLCQAFSSSPAASQVTPDGTTSTTVNTNGNNFIINNGDRAGGNLFHSFQDFSVPTNGLAAFNNALDIENIFSRVTGGNISNIDGLIRANGSANLFLINPAGIIFGSNARLDIGGSFLGSTADSILFPEGELSVVDLDNPPLLTINAPIGLNFRDEPASITATGNNDSTLSISPGQSFNLVGGEINLNTGSISVQDGKIELIGISQAGTIEIDENENFNIPETLELANINLDDFSLTISANNGNSRDINITADSLSLVNGARLVNSTFEIGNAGNVNINVTDSVLINNNSAIFANTFAQGNAGNVTIKAGNNVTLEGTNIEGESIAGNNINLNGTSTGEFTGIFSGANFDENSDIPLEGNAGTINIEANNLSIINGAIIDSSTFGSGNAGNITINANSINLSEDGSSIFSAVGSLELNAETLEGLTGNSGQINITTQTLSLSDGATIVTQTFGAGDAGTININATDSISISGVASFPVLANDDTGGFSSGLFSNSETTATGSGGEVIVTTPRLQISNGAVINARTRSTGNGGDVIVNADELEITNGSQILTTAFNSGNAGNISLNISERIFISGSDSTFSDRLNSLIETFGEEQAEFTIDPVSAESGVFANTLPDSTGNGGSISIGVFRQEGDKLVIDPNQLTNEITLNDGGRVAADSQGEGNGGLISIRVEDLTLDNQAEILAETSFPQEEDNISLSEINLEIDNILQLSNDSTISAQATNNADGGNIFINAEFIIALNPQNDGSDILATAAEGGTGGNITITTQQLFGLEERQADSGNGTNDIDASSESGVNGEVNINTLDTDVIQGVRELPANVIEQETITSAVCSNLGEVAGESSFAFTGKGGIPLKPTDPLIADSIYIEGENVTSEAEKDKERKFVNLIEREEPFRLDEIVPARGMVVKKNGNVILTAYPTPHSVQRTPVNSSNCRG